MPDSRGRIQKGEHWRKPMPYWGRDWLHALRDLPPLGTLEGEHGCGVPAMNAVYSAQDIPADLRRYFVRAEIGLEASPDAFIEALVGVFRDVRRVLRRDGTVWLNLGDSYASTGGGGDTRSGFNERYFGTGNGGKQADTNAQLPTTPRMGNGLKPKDLCGMPWRVALALQADGWWLRSCIIWAKPNPMPESVTDRPTTAHEYVFLLSKAATYYYDQESVREPAEYGRRDGGFRSGGTKYVGQSAGHMNHGHEKAGTVSGADPSTGRNLRSVWSIPTEPTPEAHFATFPQALVEPCVKAGSSEPGCCEECGAPWLRQTDVSYDAQGRTTNGPRAKENEAITAAHDVRLVKQVATPGWAPSCAHDAPMMPCTILDPFAGSGTTCLVARRLGRHSIGIDLSAEYLEIAKRRIGQPTLWSSPS